MLLVLKSRKCHSKIWNKLEVGEKSCYRHMLMWFLIRNCWNRHTFLKEESILFKWKGKLSWLFSISIKWFSSVQFSRSVVSNSLWPHESQHARPPCPSPIPGVHSDSRPLSRWCRPAISSSVVPFSSCPQSLPASESFPMSQLFAWRGRSTGVSASASFLPKNTQDWSPLEWTGWISLQSKGLSRVFSNTTVQKHWIRDLILFISICQTFNIFKILS